MELSKEFAEEHKLTEEQTTAINGLVGNGIADLKKEWDGKANKDAEGILSGAAKRIADVTGYERKEGQKIADYVSEAWESHSKNKYAELDELKNTYETKIKQAGGSEALTKEYEALKEKVENHYMKIEAEHETLKPIEVKYNALKESNENMKKQVAYASVKPKFDDSVDEYRAKYMWEEFVKNVDNKYTIEIVEDEYIAIDRDNPHKLIKLKDLVSADENLTGLTKGRQQQPLGAGQKTLKDVEGVPFQVPTDATSGDITALIQTHLTSKGLSKVNDTEKYSIEFEALWKKIRQPIVV